MAPPENKWIGIRIRLIGMAFVAVFVLIGMRAFQLQVVSGEEWQKRAERQHQQVIPLIPQRGAIYDRNGEEMALSVEVDSIFVEPRKIEDPARSARALAAALDLPYAAVREKIESRKNFLWLKRQVSLRESEAVRNLKLAGVGFTREHKRYYPNSEIGAQVIGFTGLDPQGLEGLELEYDARILGQGGYLVTERDALGRGIGPGETVIQQGSGGGSLHLTLDKNIQYIAEKELAAGIREARAKAGTAVVLDPQTGEILAMASQPDYNPNAFQRYRPSQWRNRAICDTFEPGSTFKPFLMAAALEEGRVSPGHKIYCEKGKYRVGGRAIHDHHKYETLTVSEILKFSSNIGVAKIAKMLERQRFYDYIQEFGFGRPTGIDLPGEVGGLVRDPSQWFEVDLAAISFGQGISATPLQLATATAALANGGYLMAPYVVSEVVDSYGQVVEKRQPRLVRQVVSEKTARQVREMMVEATEEGGTGTLGAVPGFRIGGKTGTAQKVDPVTGGYSVDKRVASFVGFAPADNPRLVILVVVDEPSKVTYGGLVAAPVFSRIAGQTLRYLNISPSQPLQRMAIEPLLEDEAVPRPAAIAAQGGVDGGKGRMPDFRGMSYRQVLQTMERAGINIRLDGSGRAVDQHPGPGEQVRYGSEVWVRFVSPS